MFHHATLHDNELLSHFTSSLEAGLSSTEAASRLHEHGRNEITAHQVQWYEILARQFKSAFIYLLVVAAAIVFVIGERLDASVIVGFVLLNAGLGFVQEYRSEMSLQALQEFIHPRTRVKRDGQWKVVDSAELVPGDIISLQTGDAVTADVRVLSEHNLTVNETNLTGESVAVPKRAGHLAKEPATIYDCHNLCFSGTTVVEGDATALVLATGTNTRMGSIAKLTVETTKESEFSRSITRFSSFILRMILVTLLVVLVANLLLKGKGANILELLVFGIALVVSVIPEGLPVVTTVSLSRGALGLAKHGVVVKRLTAIEDIGTIEVLCSDKTGTLTENSLTVTGYSPGAREDLLYHAAFTVAETEDKTEPFDIAIDQVCREAGRASEGRPERLAELPFDPVRRRNAVLLRLPERTWMVVRGAPEEVMALCPRLSLEERHTLTRWLEERGRGGERTIALAVRDLSAGTLSLRPADECELEFLGAMAFADPIKPSTFKAVPLARELGVAIKILTGDSPEVAGAVGQAIGLLDDPEKVLTGATWLGLPGEQRAEALEEYSVIARVTPEQKYEIIQTLQARHTVGFLGEGINDAPALKLAGVSLVVQSAADIARQAADIILLESDLEVIVDGIRSGREVFANGIKYLKSTLASNFGNFYAVAISSLMIPFLPMKPLQILLLNLLSDFPMISIATDNVDPAEWERPRKYDVREVVLISIFLGVVSTVFDLIFFATFVRGGEAVLQTNWFVGSILTELIFLFSIRTRLPFWQAVRPSSTVVWLTGVAAVATVVVPYTALGQRVFGFVPPTAPQMGVILGLVAAFFAVTEVVKGWYYRQVG
ncbi:MAG: Magnesium-transporting ATPase, P-type 1 [Chloroflexi bacterium ADurb.Bin180]|nr:MAG: Magnesium-transporting ATPase, P-type 1 [Chloroflexi bacterium ADurb.Bin180]